MEKLRKADEVTCQRPAQDVIIEGWDEIWGPRAILAWPLFSPAGCRMPGEIFPEIQLVYASCMVLSRPWCARLFERVKLLFSKLILLCMACICHYPEARRGAWCWKFIFYPHFFGDENKQVCVVAAPRTSTWFQCRELQHHFLQVAAVGVEMQSLRLSSEAPTCWKKRCK